MRNVDVKPSATELKHTNSNHENADPEPCTSSWHVNSSRNGWRSYHNLDELNQADYKVTSTLWYLVKKKACIYIFILFQAAIYVFNINKFKRIRPIHSWNSYFKIRPWKSKVKVMGGGKRWRSYNGSNIKLIHIPFVPCQSDHPFLKCSYFKILSRKSKVKVMGGVKGWYLFQCDDIYIFALIGFEWYIIVCRIGITCNWFRVQWSNKMVPDFRASCGQDSIVPHGSMQCNHIVLL